MKNVTPIRDLADAPIEGATESRRSLASIFNEMKKRRVCRAAVTYALVMWLNLQIGDVLFPMMGLPPWSLQFIVILGAMGFPAVLLLAWVFQITPQGIVVDSYEASEAKSGSPFELAINLLLLVFSFVLTLLLVGQFLAAPDVTVRATPSHVFTSLSLQPASTDEESAAFAVGLAAEIGHRLINMDDVVVAPTDATLGEQAHRLVLSGSVSAHEGTFRVLVLLFDVSRGQYLASSAFNIEGQTLAVAEAEAAGRIVTHLMQVLKRDAQ